MLRKATSLPMVRIIDAMTDKAMLMVMGEIAPELQINWGRQTKNALEALAEAQKESIETKEPLMWIFMKKMGMNRNEDE